ncbi:DUF732 domain-containing protein [Mycobacterium sp.]|uniref:DUF732 domain-containing protein n=1 Tax=Mycobacterium sp. TaxID=1785 RepID=UPI003A84823D
MKPWRDLPLPLRLLAVTAGVLTAAAGFTAPAEADTMDDLFIAALQNANMDDGDEAAEAALGERICPILSEPGGSFNSAVGTVMASQSGMSPQMARTFTSIAISVYCPSVMGNITGQLPGALQQIPGISAIPGLAGT